MTFCLKEDNNLLLYQSLNTNCISLGLGVCRWQQNYSGLWPCNIHRLPHQQINCVTDLCYLIRGSKCSSWTSYQRFKNSPCADMLGPSRLLQLLYNIIIIGNSSGKILGNCKDFFVADLVARLAVAPQQQLCRFCSKYEFVLV